MLDRLDISVEAEGSKPVNVTVEVDLALKPEAEGVDANALVKEATSEAYKAIENYLRNVK